jgi:hypothetical protein
MMNWSRGSVYWRMDWHVVDWRVMGREMVDHQVWGLMLWRRVHLQVLHWWQRRVLWCGLWCRTWLWRRVNLQVLRWWQDDIVCWDHCREAVWGCWMWIGDLLQTSELLLEALQLAADGYDVAAAAAPGERVADGADLLAVWAGVDELVLPVLQGVHDRLEGMLNGRRGRLVVLEYDVSVHGDSGQNEERGDEELHGRAMGRSLWVSFTLCLLGLGQWAQY